MSLSGWLVKGYFVMYFLIKCNKLRSVCSEFSTGLKNWRLFSNNCHNLEIMLKVDPLLRGDYFRW